MTERVRYFGQGDLQTGRAACPSPTLEQISEYSCGRRPDLIRTAGLTDTFIYNLGVVSIGLGVGSMLYYGPAFYPQGNLVWGCVIAGRRNGDDFFRFHHLDHYVAALGRHLRVRFSYSAAGTRTHHEPGGDHRLAFLLCHRRILDRHPGTSRRCSPALNLLTGNETFLTISKTMLEPWATFLIGAAILLLSQVVLSYGMRFYLTLNKWVFLLAMASTFFLIVVLASRNARAVHDQSQ